MNKQAISILILPLFISIPAQSLRYIDDVKDQHSNYIDDAVLSSVKGQPAVTHAELKEKYYDILKRTNYKVVGGLPGFLQKMFYFDGLLICMTEIKIAQLYVQDNNINSRTDVTFALAEFIRSGLKKELSIDLKSDEMSQLLQVTAAGMHLIAKIRRMPAIAQGIKKLDKGTIKKEYAKAVQEAKEYGWQPIPTYQEIKPLLKVYVASKDPSWIREKVAEEMKKVAEEYKVTFDKQACNDFIQLHCKPDPGLVY